MRPIGCVVLLLIAAVLAATPAACGAAPAAPAAFAPVARVQLVTLRNGLRLLLAPDTTASAVDVSVWYPDGTMREPSGMTGIARLFEQLMFAGSAHVAPQEHARQVQAEGGLAGAYTEPDFSCYYETVPSGAVEMALKLEADRIASLQLTDASLDLARRAERRLRDQTQSGTRLVQALFRLAWPDHPYGRPAEGPDQDLDRISLAACQAYHAANHAPNVAVVSVVGRFDADETTRWARRWLEPIGRRPSGAVTVSEPPQRSERRAAASMAAPLPTLLVGWKTPGRPDPDGPALALLTRIFAGGPSSRLQRAVLAESLQCVTVQGALDSRRASGLLHVVVAMRPGVDSAAVEQAVLAEADRLAREPVSQEELEVARRQEVAGQLFTRQTARGCAEQLGSALLLDGDWRAAARRIDGLGQVTPADVRRVAARVFTAERRSVLMVTPAAPRFGIPPAEGGR